MDTSDPSISFDAEGVCNHCREWEKQWIDKKRLEEQYPNRVISWIKKRGKGRKYDAVLGMSGGADSSYVYHLAKMNGLRVYPLHFDNGYDLPEYDCNVRNLTEFWSDQLNVVKVDGEEFRRLQVAFLASGTTGLEIPTDHAIKAVTYQTARKLRVPTILNGTNIATESHGSPAWTGGHSDWKYIRGIGERFGVKLSSFPHYTPLDLLWMNRIKWVSLLDYTEYVRDEAISLMQAKYGYKPYGFKHGENRITRFLHGYIIPRRFGWDTRRSRLAAMVASGQMSREDALRMLSHPMYPEPEVLKDREIILGNLGITDAAFEEYMKLPLKHFKDYPSYQRDLVESGLYRSVRGVYRRFLK